MRSFPLKVALLTPVHRYPHPPLPFAHHNAVLDVVAWGFYRSLGTQRLFAAAVLDD